MKKWKVLNLYAGIGGNRKLWSNENEVTAVEIDPNIAKIYQDFFPNDKVIVADAHQYLLEHFKEFDFIWSSPPCPTHSRMRNLKNNCPECEKKYPDMKLYEEIIFLKHFCKGKFCVENVISYYEPLVKPQKSDNHYFWCNFLINKMKPTKRDIRGVNDIEYKEKLWEFSLEGFDIPNRMKLTLLNNVVNPKLGKHILDCARKNIQQNLNILKEKRLDRTFSEKSTKTI